MSESLMSSRTSLNEKDREIVEKSIQEQRKKEEENKLIQAEKAETGRVSLYCLSVDTIVKNNKFGCVFSINAVPITIFNSLTNYRWKMISSFFQGC